MWENIINFFKKVVKAESHKENSKEAAKERLHLVLMQDRANVSADFLDMMKQEIIEVIKKYIDVDENAIDVKLTNKTNEDGTNGAPALYANIPIISIKQKAEKEAESEKEDNKEDEAQKEKVIKEESEKKESKEEQLVEETKKEEKKDKDSKKDDTKKVEPKKQTKKKTTTKKEATPKKEVVKKEETVAQEKK